MPSGNPQLISDSEVAGMLKRLYDNLSVDFFPQSTVLLANLQKAGPGGPFNMRWGAEGIRYNAVTGSPVGLTSSPSGYLPPDASRTEVQGSIDIERVYVRRQVDMKLIQGTTSKEAAYRTIGTKVVGEAKAAYKRGMQFYAHGDADGIRGIVDSVTSTTVIVVDNPNNIADSGQGGLHLGVGMYVAVLDTSASDAVLGRAYITVLSTASDLTTVTLGTAITGMAAGDKVVACTASDTEKDNVPNGLINISNRGNSYVSLHGISATTYPETGPTRMVAGTDTPNTTDFTEEDVWELIAKVAGKSGFDANEQGSDFLIITTPGLVKRLAQSFFGQRQWAMASKVKLKGGFNAVEICGVPVVGDPHAPAGTVYLLHLPSFCWVDGKDFGAVAFNDAGVWRWIADRDAYETSWSHFFNFGAPQRNAIGSITSFSDSARYTHI